MALQHLPGRQQVLLGRHSELPKLKRPSLTAKNDTGVSAKRKRYFSAGHYPAIQRR